MRCELWDKTEWSGGLIGSDIIIIITKLNCKSSTRYWPIIQVAEWTPVPSSPQTYSNDVRSSPPRMLDRGIQPPPIQLLTPILTWLVLLFHDDTSTDAASPVLDASLTHSRGYGWMADLRLGTSAWLPFDVDGFHREISFLNFSRVESHSHT